MSYTLSLGPFSIFSFKAIILGCTRNCNIFQTFLPVFILNRDPSIMVRGIEITANHVKSISSGYVFANAKAIHKGKTIQLWEIRVTDEEDQLISLCKLTTYSRQK